MVRRQGVQPVEHGGTDVLGIDVQQSAVAVGDLADGVAAPDDLLMVGVLTVDDAVEGAVVGPEDLVLVGEARRVGKAILAVVLVYARKAELGQLLLGVDHADLAVYIAEGLDLLVVELLPLRAVPMIREPQVGILAIHGQIAGDVEDVPGLGAAGLAQIQGNGVAEIAVRRRVVVALEVHARRILLRLGAEAVAGDGGDALQRHVGQGEQTAALAAGDVAGDGGAVHNHPTAVGCVVLADAAAVAIGLVVGHGGVFQLEGHCLGVDAAAGVVERGGVVIVHVPHALSDVAGDEAVPEGIPLTGRGHRERAHGVVEHAAAHARGGVVSDGGPAEGGGSGVREVQAAAVLRRRRGVAVLHGAVGQGDGRCGGEHAAAALGAGVAGVDGGVHHGERRTARQVDGVRAVINIAVVDSAAFVGGHAVADDGSAGDRVVIGIDADVQQLGPAVEGAALIPGGAAVEAAAENDGDLGILIEDVDGAAVVAQGVGEGAVPDGVIGGRASHGAAVAVVAGAVEAVAVFKAAGIQNHIAFRCGFFLIQGPHVERAAVSFAGCAVLEIAARDRDIFCAALHGTCGHRPAVDEVTICDRGGGFKVTAKIMEYAAALTDALAGIEGAAGDRHILHTGPDAAAAVLIC